MSVNEDSVCRICGEDDTDEPLFHPCRCSGSIRHIHEDCLVKWLTMKSNLPGGDAVSLHEANVSECELCGHTFQFSFEYSKEISESAGFSVSLSIAYEIGRSALGSLIRVSLPVVHVLFLCLLFPMFLGTLMLLSLSVVAGTDFEVYEYSVLNVFQSGLRQYLIGSVIALVGATFADKFRRRLPRGSLFRQLHYLAAFGGGIIGVVAGFACLVVPYWLGLGIVGKLLDACSGSYQGVCVALSPRILVVRRPLLDVNVDLVVLLTGFVSIGLIISLAVAISKAYNCGISAILAKLKNSVSNLLDGFCHFIVPLAIGRLIVIVYDLELHSPISFLSLDIVLTFLIGLTVTVPTLFLQSFLGDHFVAAEAKLNLSWVSHTVLFGSVNGGNIFTASLLRFGVYLLTSFFAILPFIAFLIRIKLLPLSFTLSTSGVSSSPSSSLPLELFYIHVLIPLVLHPPPVPRIIRDSAELFKQLPLFMMIPLLFASIWAVLILGIAIPMILGRFICVNCQDDLVAFPMGFLVLLLAFHIGFRITCVSGGGSHLSIISYSDFTRRFLKTLVSLVGLGVVVPLLIGVAFQVGLIMPMRSAVAATHNAYPRQMMPADNLVPLWVIGIMLCKIFFALVTIGFFPRVAALWERIKSVYVREGMLSDSLHALIFRSVLGPSIKNLFLFSVVPYIFGFAFNVGECTVIVFWASYAFFSHVLPGLIRFAVARKQIAINRKYLIRTKLVNFQTQ